MENLKQRFLNFCKKLKELFAGGGSIIWWYTHIVYGYSLFAHHRSLISESTKTLRYYATFFARSSFLSDPIMRNAINGCYGAFIFFQCNVLEALTRKTLPEDPLISLTKMGSSYRMGPYVQKSPPPSCSLQGFPVRNEGFCMTIDIHHFSFNIRTY